MQETRKKMIKKGSVTAIQRMARRQQRLLLLSSTPEQASLQILLPVRATVPFLDNVAQHKLIMELAWRTAALLDRNLAIQKKLIDLRKETSDFITASASAAIDNTEQRPPYFEYVEVCKIAQPNLQECKEPSSAIEIDTKT